MTGTGVARDPASPAARRRARLAGMVVIAIALIILALDVVWIARHVDTLRPVSAGDLAPPFSVPEVDAAGRVGPGRLDLAELRGKVVLIDFWATWCGPCRESLPAIGRIYQRHAAQGLAVVSMNTDDPVKARAMLRALRVDVPLYVDTVGVADLYRVTTIPHVVLVDRLGVVRHVHRGFAGEDELAEDVQQLLASGAR